MNVMKEIRMEIDNLSFKAWAFITIGGFGFGYLSALAVCK